MRRGLDASCCPVPLDWGGLAKVVVDGCRILVGDMGNQAIDQAALASSYDLVPYDSQPFAEAHPTYLGALGVLHGLDCALPSDCRVLELGCASGGHMIPLAWYQPNST